MTDIEDIWHDQRATEAWLMDMLRQGKDPIESVRKQCRAVSNSMGEFADRMDRARHALMLACVPDSRDTKKDAKLKRKFVGRGGEFRP